MKGYDISRKGYNINRKGYKYLGKEIIKDSI
jgi:hypothetical protein